MSVVFLDFETRSTVGLPNTGVYPYAEHPDTGIWCMAYAFDDEEPQVWLPTDGNLPDRLAQHIWNGEEMHAWNAQFERLVWRHKMTAWVEPTLTQWHCTMARAATYGLPLHLAQAASALLVDEQKDMEGKRLMMQMSRPRRLDEDGRPVWWDDPDKLRRLIEYCKQDVRTERAIHHKLQEPSCSERRIWVLDQQINDRGVGLDLPLIEAAKECAEVALEQANTRLEEITNGEVTAVSEVVSLTAWLNKHTPCDSVAKPAVEDMLAREVPADVREALMLRREAGKSSVAKLATMLDYRAADGRAHGLLQYMGASGTGRWAGRGIQPQNFPRGVVKDVENFIPAVLNKNLDAIRSAGAAPMEVISSMLRSTFIAKPDHRFIVEDYNAIEARVLAWLAGQEDLIELFRTGGKVYETMAATIFDVPVESVAKGSKERHVGKEAVLGLGYQMGWSKFQARCASQAKVQLSDEKAREAVTAYRAKNDKIARLWSSMEQAALSATNLRPVRIAGGKIEFFRSGEWLVMRLPSKRTLKYFKPRAVERETPWGATKTGVMVTGVNSTTKQWGNQYLYGGLLVENAVQAIARDLLADAMVKLDDAGYPIVLTVHDEVVVEPQYGFGSQEEVERIMQTVPDWAVGCPVTVEGWEGERYKK